MLKTQEIYNLIIKWFVSLFEKKQENPVPEWETKVMRKFDKITDQISKEQYNSDLLKMMSLIREKYHGVIPKVIDYNDLPKEEKIIAIDRLAGISKDRYFNMICDKLIDNQKEDILRKAENYDEVMFDRATVNGIELIRDILVEAEGQLAEMKKSSEPFDKFKTLPE